MSYQYMEKGWYWGEIGKRDFVNASLFCPQNFGILSKKVFLPRHSCIDVIEGYPLLGTCHDRCL